MSFTVLFSLTFSPTSNRRTATYIKNNLLFLISDSLLVLWYYCGIFKMLTNVTSGYLGHSLPIWHWDQCSCEGRPARGRSILGMMLTHSLPAMSIGPASVHIEHWYARFRKQRQEMTLVYANIDFLMYTLLVCHITSKFLCLFFTRTAFVTCELITPQEKTVI